MFFIFQEKGEGKEEAQEGEEEIGASKETKRERRLREKAERENQHPRRD